MIGCRAVVIQDNVSDRIINIQINGTIPYNLKRKMVQIEGILLHVLALYISNTVEKDTREQTKTHDQFRFNSAESLENEVKRLCNFSRISNTNLLLRPPSQLHLRKLNFKKPSFSTLHNTTISFCFTCSTQLQWSYHIIKNLLQGTRAN